MNAKDILAGSCGKVSLQDLDRPAVYTPYSSLKGGYYHIISIQNVGLERVLIVRSSQELHGLLSDYELRLREKQLFNRLSTYQCNAKLQEGNVLHIKSINLKEYVYDGKVTKTYDIDWILVK